jgi:hypothetical protein
MKWINNNTTLCIEFDEMVQVLMLEKGCVQSKADKALRDAKYLGTRGYGFINAPYDGRVVLLVWEDMDRKYKRMVERWLRKTNGCQHPDSHECECGNPHHYMATEPIRKMFVTDEKAMAFYLAYRKPDGSKLDTQVIQQNAMACGVYNAVLKAMADKKGIIKGQLGFKEVTAFHNAVLELCKQMKSNGQLPKQFATSYVRYLANLDSYKKEGYSYFVHGQLGNQGALKIADAACESYLKDLIAHPNQYDDVLVCVLYNKWAADNGYKEIKPGIVGVRRREWEYELMPQRKGNSAYNEKYIREVKGFAPTCPLYLVECDDYNLNYYFTAEDGSKYARYVSYIVADSYNGLVLGKSYRVAKSPVFEMAQLAWIDAMYYVRSLVNDGNWYLPFEVKADHWNATNMFPLLNSIGNFVPPAHGNKHRGYIEQLFGSPHAKRAEKMAAHKTLNYNGNNVTARNTGVNLEIVKQNEKLRPMVGVESDAQIETFFHYMRQMPAITGDNLNAPSKEAQWVERWHQLDESQKRSITDEQFLFIFGIRHEPQGRPVTITNRGIETQIKGTAYSYDLPHYVGMTHLIGSKVTVIYDPYDMSRVLITNDADIRFVAHTATLQARALQDATPGSREMLNALLEDKKVQWEGIAAAQTKRREIDLDYVTLPDTKAVLMGGMLPKELKNVVETAYEMEQMEVENEPFNVAKARLKR